MPHWEISVHSAGKRRFKLALSGWFCCALVLVSLTKAERLPVKTYTTTEGLPRDLVTRIRRDSRGFLWFCTAEGISRFDGMEMTTFTVADGLPDQSISDFLETSSGTIYIATNKGLARLNPRGTRDSKDNPLFTVFLPATPRSQKIQILYEDKDRNVWIGTSDGLFKLIETGGSPTFESVPLGEPLGGFGGAIFRPSPNTLFVTSILQDRSGTLWVGTFGSGLFRRSADGTVRRFSAPENFGDNKVTALAEDREGRIWMGMRSDQEGGVCQLDPQNSEHPVKNCFTEKHGLGSNRIRDILVGQDGQMWLAMVPGLCHWQADGGVSVCKVYGAKNGLCNDIYTLAEDGEGNLWTGSPCGAKKIARYGFTTYDEGDGLDKAHVSSIFENAAGELFVTTFPKNGRFISRFEGDRFTTARLEFSVAVDYHGWGWQQIVWQDSRGAWWIPTGSGLYRTPDGTAFESLVDASLGKLETGAKGEEPFRLFEDSRGDLWLGIINYRNELLRWQRAKNIWHYYTERAGITDSRVVTAFIEDFYGNVWIGASSDHNDGALIRYRRGEFRLLTAAEGASSGWISDLFLDSRGRLWIATNQDGLLRLDETNSDRFEFTKYTTADGLTSITTNCVAEDEFGRIYIGTWQGIDRLDPDSGQIENFTTADGLPASYVESAYRDRTNHLWFLTEKGLARFKPEPPRQRKPPNILITGLRVEGEPQVISILGETHVPRLDLGSDQRQIAVEFLGVGTSLGEKLKYEFRFGNADWTPTDERRLNFANLGAGDYVFQVRARTADGIYTLTPAAVSFRIGAPFWQRSWFLSLIVLAVGGFIYTVHKYRLRRLLELERVRTRIATDLHDDIGSNLTKISIMSEVAQRLNGKRREQILRSIADISRSSVSSMSDIVWAINPKKDSFLELTRRMRAYADETLGQNDIVLTFDSPGGLNELKLDAEVRRNVYLIFKESLNNIVRHSQASKVEIELEIMNNDLVLSVADNGAGFDQAVNHDGNGLYNMKRRAADLNGRLAVFSARNEGARIVLEVPLAKAV